MTQNQSSDSLIVSYLALRRLIGFLGMALPLAALSYTAITRGPIEVTISTYYYTGLRDIFVAILCSTGVFMLVYKGYKPDPGKLPWDRIASSFAGACAVLVAFFPTGKLPGGIVNKGMSDTVHVFSAAGLFLTFACMSLFLFTKTSGDPTPKKKVRNRWYKGCGYAIFLFIALIILLPQSADIDWQSTFWLEALSLFAFGISWLVKGETILKDAESLPEVMMDEIGQELIPQPE
jgi:hypothetical protein